MNKTKFTVYLVVERFSEQLSSVYATEELAKQAIEKLMASFPTTQWKIIEEEKVTMFGTSASYLNFIRSQELKPGKDYDLSSLREIWQTGSALLPEGFEYVYREIKEDVHFNSSSGGTDINGCFCTGSPIQPVHAGQLQGPALGMKIKAYEENGNAVFDQQGELVCEAPAPSMPLYFWNDAEDKR